MTDINFNCPHCAQNIDAPPDMAGQTAPCPACTRTMIVPLGGTVHVSDARLLQVLENSSDVQTPVSEKSRTTASLLCFLLGAFGVHRFYTGKVKSGVIQLITLGGLGFWTLIDFILLVGGKFSDQEGKPVTVW